MEMLTDALKQVEEIGLLPIVNVDDPSKAVPTAQALIDGGIRVVETTFRGPAALDSLKNIRKAFPDLLIAAGTVVRTEQVDAAIDAGADFIVSPGLNPKTVEYCQRKNIAILPGATTATELELGTSLGLSIFKFFPADVAGGLGAIKALGGPFGGVRFVPTGGINFNNMKEYAESAAVVALGGSFFAPNSAVDAGDWTGIAANAKRAVDLSLGLTMGHLGINCESADEARTTAKWFDETFGFAPREIAASFFSASAVESMKKPSYGAKGHIGIATNSMTRAIYHLQRRGVKFRDFKYGADGAMIAAYLTEEIGGFAAHLCPKY